MLREDFIDAVLEKGFTLYQNMYGKLVAYKKWKTGESVKIMYNYSDGRPYFVTYINHKIHGTFRTSKFNLNDIIEKAINGHQKENHSGN